MKKQFFLVIGVMIMAMFCTLGLPKGWAGDTFPAPLYDPPAAAEGDRKIVLAGGCFWGVEAVFESIRGVKSAVSGYAGGREITAKYDIVSTGMTGHAEAVEVTYDPKMVSLGKLLQVFFSVAHDPTQLNRQGPDSGTQYRSAIFFSSEEEKKTAEKYIAQLSDTGVYKDPVVTEISPLDKFYPAEDYHQNFMRRNPDYPYIVIHDAPKIKLLKDLYPEIYVGAAGG